MTKTQTIILILLAIAMAGLSIALGNWAASINPEGIAPHPGTDGDTLAESAATRDAFSFGVSMGLLGMSLLYACIAFGKFIHARAQQVPASHFTYYLAGLAGLGFALSYVVDDYFY